MNGLEPMPAGLRLVRTTPEFTDTSVPTALLAAHRVAAGVWGRLRVLDGSVRFVFETDPPSTHDLGTGDAIDIPPEVPHRVVPGVDARFVVEFHSSR